MIRWYSVLSPVVAAGLLGAVAWAVTPAAAPQAEDDNGSSSSNDLRNLDDALAQILFGREIFRFETFGDEAFWGDTLRLHEAIAGEDFGGIGPGLSPETALAIGLKIDVDALPRKLQIALRRGRVDLGDPATTLALLKLNSVVGVRGVFNDVGRLQSVGITCALCHSDVDDSLSNGIGHRLDGWAARDLDVGAIIALAPNLQPFVDLLRLVDPTMDETTVRDVVLSWGPGKFDAELLMDGKAFRPDGRSGATLIPPAFGLAGINLHTWTGWGSVTHWNGLVANLEMQGQGTFFDPRLNDPIKFPIAAAAGFGDVRHQPDLVTPKLAPLHVYQLSLSSPQPPRDSYVATAATRGEAVFEGKAGCARCHVPPLFTEPGWNMHLPAEIGIDSFQSDRSPDERYRTAPLRGLWTHGTGGYYHDGRFATLGDVIDHYDRFFGLRLSALEKTDLIEYLKSL